MATAADLQIYFGRIPHQILKAVGDGVSDVAPVPKTVPIGKADRGELADLKTICPEDVQAAFDRAAHAVNKRHDPNHRKHADGDPQHRETGAELVRGERRKCEAEDFGDEHGAGESYS